jgi:urea transport system substrate-binding protein
MSHPSDPRTPGSPNPEIGRRRVLQALGAASVAGLPAWSFAQPTAQVNTTKLAVTDSEVVVGQLHSATVIFCLSFSV